MPVLQSVFVLRSSAVFLMKALCYSDSQSDLSYSMVYWFQYCSRYTVWPNCVICVFFLSLHVGYLFRCYGVGCNMLTDPKVIGVL